MGCGKCNVADIQHLFGPQRTTDTYLKSCRPNMDELGSVLDEEAVMDW
jgi:hypothetical protein